VACDADEPAGRHVHGSVVQLDDAGNVGSDITTFSYASLQ
jgi:hypothetical protein